MSIPLVVCVVGLILYFLFSAREPRVSEVGRICFWVGLLVYLLSVSAAKLF